MEKVIDNVGLDGYKKEDSYTDRVETKFNAGLAKLKRIDDLHQWIHKARISADYDGWFDCIIGLRNELQERMTPEQINDSDEFEKYINGAFHDIRKGRNSLYPHKPKFNLWSELNKYERFLFIVEFQNKMGLTDKPDSFDAARE